MTYLLTFLAAALLDIQYVHWVKAVADDRPVRAMLCAVSIGACGVAGLTAVVDDRLQVIPYLAGLAVGTLVGMKVKR